MSGKGHNSAAELLRELVERMDALDQRKEDILDDMKSVRGEVKAEGLDPKVFAELLRRRKRRRKGEDVDTFDQILETYEGYTGILS